VTGAGAAAARILRFASRPELRGRLGDFRWAGRSWPLAAFAAVLAAFYAWHGPSGPFWMLLELWAAYSTAWLALATLASLKGVDARWRLVLPTAVGGVLLGGLVAATITFAPNWQALFDSSRLLPEWGLGAAFSAFFIALSLLTAEVRGHERRAADTRQQLLEARLQTLTAQIEPHFLMNTLANLRYLIKNDTAAASRMLEHLADFLQGALDRSRTTHSTLGQEVELVESYLKIMQLRLGGRLEFRIASPPELAGVSFPPLLLQTLVENALRHGIEPASGGGTVDLTIQREGAKIVLRVSDDGVGLKPESVPGVGLRNTLERLSSFYDGRASFDLGRGAQSGTVATVSIPAPTT
jgi:signal transduction histidine kinase